MFNFSESTEHAYTELGTLREGETFYLKGSNKPMIKTDEVTENDLVLIVALGTGVILREYPQAVVRITTLNVTSTDS
jgi:hypothetical protein